MNSPCLPAARAEPAAASSAAVMAPAASFRTRSEIGGELHTAWTNHRSAALKTGETTGGRAGVSLGRPAANRKIKNGAEHQARSAHRKADSGDIAFLFGRIDVPTAARRAAIALTGPVEIVLGVHRHDTERTADTDAHQAHAPGHVRRRSTGRLPRGLRRSARGRGGDGRSGLRRQYGLCFWSRVERGRRWRVRVRF